MHKQSNFLDRCRKSKNGFKLGLALLAFAILPMLFLHAEEIFPEQSLSAPSVFQSVRFDQSVATGDDPHHIAIADYFSRRYRIASEVLEQLVYAVHVTGQKNGVDPLLILSVIAIESRFNPFAESEMGAKGLMQVMPQYHQDKLAKVGGEDAVLDPVINIHVGTQILKDCIRRGGGLEAGLQLYAGALGDPESQYAQKVMAEKDRLNQALRRSIKQHSRAAAVADINGRAI